MTQPLPDEPLPTEEYQPPQSTATPAGPEALSTDLDTTRIYQPAPHPRPPDTLPSVPGYEIESVLGRGGMGVVYKARHLSLKRTVALKMILAGGHAGVAEQQRFRTEAEAVARLQHPNIVQVFEVGEQQGLPYCALEFVE